MGTWLDFDEDAYWERVREERENPHRRRCRCEEDEEPPEPEEGTLFLDEELEELETEYDCTLQELPEGDLMDIVERYENITPISARWDDRFQCIDYKYEEDCA